jgi:hypothetical protein
MEGPNLVAKIQWDDSDANPLGQTVAHQFRSGFLSAVSVGFQPGEAIRRNALDESHPHYAERGNVFRDNELLEISAVPIPANPEALARRAMTDFESKHILGVEETEDGVQVLYARGGEMTEEQSVETPQENELESYSDEDEDEKKRLEERERRTITLHEVRCAEIRRELIRLLRGDEQVQAAIDEIAEMRAEASCGISNAVADIFGFTD